MSARKLSGSEAEQSGRLPPSTPPAGFTLEPWQVVEDGNGRIFIKTKGNATVAIVVTGNGHADANARLIAAAPALYAVVQDFFRAHDELGDEPARGGRSFGEVLGQDFFKAARAALAAAQPQGGKP